jgi:hypothetical protein
MALGAVGFVLGLIAWAVVISEAKPGEAFAGRDAKAIILAPVLFPIPFMILGAVGSLAVAPTEFLRGPAGRRWMAIFGGTTNPATARAFCWVVLSLMVGVPIGLALLIWWNRP